MVSPLRYRTTSHMFANTKSASVTHKMLQSMGGMLFRYFRRKRHGLMRLKLSGWLRLLCVRAYRVCVRGNLACRISRSLSIQFAAISRTPCAAHGVTYPIFMTCCDCHPKCHWYWLQTVIDINGFNLLKWQRLELITILLRPFADGTMILSCKITQ